MEMEKMMNGEVVDVDKDHLHHNRQQVYDETLYGLIQRFLAAIFLVSSDSDSDSDSSSPPPLLQRIKTSINHNAPLLPQASINTGRNILLWTRQGTPLRALLVISVGSIILLAVTGLLVFIVVFVVATASAVIFSLLVALAAAGGFLALFFASLATIYVGALMMAAFVISTATISTITVSLIVTGWIGFFWVIWLVTKKSLDLAKHSLSITGSTFLAYSASRVHRSEMDKKSN